MEPLIIEAGKTERGYWRDIWRFRELMFLFSWRDLLVRYKQAVFGVLWAFLRPVLTLLVFNLVFHKLANVQSDGLPYLVMVAAGLLPWMFFSSALTEASYSLNENHGILTKVYFPRMLLPASAILVTMFDYVIAIFMLLALMIYYRVLPGWQLIFAPVFVFQSVIACFGASLWFAALNVKYRDFRYLIVFLIQYGLYLTPVAFPSEIVRHKYGPVAYHIFCLNPMVGVINGIRWSLGGNFNVPLDLSSVLISVILTLFVGYTGMRYFRATEDSFPDIM